MRELRIKTRLINPWKMLSIKFWNKFNRPKKTLKRFAILRMEKNMVSEHKNRLMVQLFYIG